MNNFELNWRVNNQSGFRKISPGINRIIVSLNRGEIFTRAEAECIVPKAPKMFFNGFQTWTHCPEYTPEKRIRGLNGFPKFAGRLLALDHFADYHFIEYPNRKGILHGVSYCYFRNGAYYRLFASLDEKPGYTLFTYDTASESLKLERDCRGTAASESVFHAFDLFYAEGSENEVFDLWFDALGIHNKMPPVKGYSSWYNHFRRINIQKIEDDLNGAKRIFEPGDLFQIDDGWERFTGDWEETDNRKFPEGLKPVVQAIHSAGFQAGLWLAPFVCEKNSKIFKEHPDWLLLYNGKPWKNGPNWGGSYSLDIDNPKLIEYLSGVFRKIFDEWKFDLVKLDFLYAAAPFATGDHGNQTDKPFSESRAARMIRAMEFLRECCKGKLILGCGVPVMPAFGLVDYCRIGCDVSLSWDDFPFMRNLHRERVSTRQSTDNTIFRRQLNGRAYGSDPDVFFLRDNNIFLSDEIKYYHAVLNALFGSVWLTSDNLNGYTESKTLQYKQLAKLKNASDIHIDPDTLTITYSLEGKKFVLPYPADISKR